MWLKLLLQLRELLPLLGRVLPLLEGWVAGNSGASAANNAALKQLEARIGTSVEGLDGINAQLRDQGTVVLHLANHLKQLQQQMEAGRAAAEIQAKQAARSLRHIRWILVLAMVLLVAILVVVLILLLNPAHAGRITAASCVLSRFPGAAAS